MKIFLTFLSLVFISTEVLAVKGDFSCPETHPEYSKVLSELENFKETLKDKLECKEVAINFDKLTELLSAPNRKELLSLVNSTNGKPLSADSAEKIQNFAGSVTEEIAVALSLIGTEGGLLDFFTGTNKCNLDEEEEFQAIERLTKAAYVATNLVSKVAGPYGVPLQIGARAFYGVVQGLQSYSKRKRHIDFDDFEKREFFEGAVCLMSKFDSDIRKLNNPESHLRHLQNARDEAQRVVNTLAAQNTKIKIVVQRKKESIENLAWIENQIVKYSEIAEFKTGGIGPRELQALKIAVNKFLLGTAAPEFINWYSRKAGQSTKDVVRSSSSSLNALRADLKLYGKKIDFSLPDSIRSKYPKEHYPLGVPFGIRQNYVRETPEITNLYFISLNMKNLSEEAYQFNSVLGETYDLWKLSDLNVRVAQEYCEFFQKKNQYNNSVSRACENRSYTRYALRTSYQAFYLANLINGNGSLATLGPFDFRLDKHKRYIKKYSRMVKSPFSLASEGLSFEDIMKLDKRVRFRDGRLRTANSIHPEAQSDQDEWWFHAKKLADQYLEHTLK